MQSPAEIQHAAVARLEGVLPGATDVHFNPTEPPFLSISFEFSGATHSLRLRREAGIWHAREWIVDGQPQQLDTNQSSPRFEALVATVLGYEDRHPTVEVREMRCPDDPRKLFCKAIVQRPLPVHRDTNLIEFSCPSCKRRTGHVTMHYFSITGELVKTEALEPWVRRESAKVPWHQAVRENVSPAPQGA